MDEGPVDFSDVHGASVSSFFSLTAASLAMFVGCYLAGSIPLYLPLSESKTRSMSVFGSGLLIGTALAVILPEGLSMVQPHAHIMPCLQKSVVPVLNQIQDQSPKLLTKPGANDELNLYVQKDANAAQDPSARDEKSAESHNRLESLEKHDHSAEHTHSEHVHSEGDANFVIGAALVLGFVVMLVVDHFSAGSHSHGPPAHHALDAESMHKFEANGTNGRSRVKITATLGLLVHAAADGIAMAAVSSSRRSELQLLVFAAIMLHKFPASFGLVTFLLGEKLDRARIKKHLMAFSLAAPLGAFATYLFMAVVSAPSTTGSIFSNFSGKAMLFSAGTFLYVATIHILPNIQHSSPGGHLSHSHVLIFALGSVFPFILCLGHHHDHT